MQGSSLLQLWFRFCSPWLCEGMVSASNNAGSRLAPSGNVLPQQFLGFIGKSLGSGNSHQAGGLAQGSPQEQGEWALLPMSCPAPLTFLRVCVCVSLLSTGVGYCGY